MRDSSSPSALSNDDLLSATRALIVRSSEVTAQLIAHLAEVDVRKLYLEQAQPSMFSWCVAELGCSEDVACNWIAVARASRRYPAVLDALREGKVHLTGLRLLAPHLTEEGHRGLLEEATGRSKREMEELVARIAPRPAVPASIRKLPSAGTKDSKGVGRTDQPANGAASDNGDGLPGILSANGKASDKGDGRVGRPANGSCDGAAEARTPLLTAPTSGNGLETSPLSTDEESEPLSSPHPGSSRAAPRTSHRPSTPGRVEPLSAEAYKVTFTASRRLRDKLRQAQDLLGHQVPNGDLAEILERGLDLLMEDVRKRRFAAGRKPRASTTKRREAKSSARQRREPPAVETKPSASETTPTAATETKPTATETNPRATERPRSKRANRSRYIPADVRRAVFERDGGQCTYADERGRRCPEKRRLEYDHADGFARGALHTIDRIRLRCQPHNQFEAERMYGRAFMENRREAKASAPARVPLDSPAERSNQGR